MKPLISPPFGNWISHPRCTRVLGSFTWKRRRGLVYHTLRSFRPTAGGWVNHIGLRNPGLRTVRIDTRHVYSLAGLEDGDWEEMLPHCPVGTTIELNLSCPNVHEYGIPFGLLQRYCRRYNVIAKLPPTAAIDDMAAMCIEAGAWYLHCSNTLPIEHGGESGRRLFDVNLPIVERLAGRYPTQIIAGGGIYHATNVAWYRQAGATQFSLATVWLTPWRVRGILDAIDGGG